MKKIIIAFLLVLGFTAFAQSIKQGGVTVELTNGHNVIAIESQHDTYSTLFAVDYQNPEVALAYLDRENVNEKGFKRPTSFTVQNAPKKVKVRPADFTNTGFERGHMIPNDMFDYNVDKQKDTFSVYNISPQYPECNADGSAWWKIEQQIELRAWDYGRVYVITGPILDKKPNQYEKISAHEIVVPEKYYKILISYNTDADIDEFESIEIYFFSNTPASEKITENCLQIAGNREADTIKNAIAWAKTYLNLKITLDD